MTIKTQHNYLKKSIWTWERLHCMMATPQLSHLYLMLTTGALSLRNPNYFSHSLAPVTFGALKFFLYYYNYYYY